MGKNSPNHIKTDLINIARNVSGPWQISINTGEEYGGVPKWNLMKFGGIFDLTMDWVDLVNWNYNEYKIRMIQ
jgi:hypothetical protein